MKTSEEIKSLLEWKGSWAIRALFDDAVIRYLNNQDQDFELAKIVIQNSSGFSAVNYYQKYCQLTGFYPDNIEIPQHINRDTQSIIDLSRLHLHNLSYELRADFWLEKLCIHLDTNRKNLAEKIKTRLANEELASGDVIQLIDNWSFPLIQKIFPFLRQENPIEYVEREIANLCWKRWFLIKNKVSVLLETPTKTNLKSSQWLVWRLLHDATHLLHLQNFPEAGCYLNPNWLATLESVAITTEREFLRLIDDGVEIPKPQNYPFNLFNIKTILLIGLCERALRLEYDLAIHLNEQKIEQWIIETKRKTGLNFNCYNFATEFHGLPGFCATYMLGLKAFECEQDKISILNGTKPLNLFNWENNDQFSLSPLTDIPSKLPQHCLYIQSVGTSESSCFFKLFNPFINQYIDVEAIANVTVSLNYFQRGIHMSRLQQILNNLDQENFWDKLEDVTQFIAKQAKELQNSDRAEVTLIVSSYVETFNQKSQTRSKQPIKIIANTISTNQKTVNTIGLTIKVITACPCTLQYSRLRSEENLKDFLGLDFHKSVINSILPTFTHSQIGTLTVKITSQNKLILITNLYNQINSVAHLVETVLKRPDEHSLVYKSHSKPQFCEDLCREVAVSVASILNADDVIEISSELDESIHPHKAFAKLTTNASDAWYF
jgi:GTP cyclohydrolase FolE2